jgi:hypothetical protein
MTPGIPEHTRADIQRDYPAWELYRAFEWEWARLRDRPDIRVRGEDEDDLYSEIVRAESRLAEGDLL